jgi:hypothetical protein
MHIQLNLLEKKQEDNAKRPSFFTRCASFFARSGVVIGGGLLGGVPGALLCTGALLLPVLASSKRVQNLVMKEINKRSPVAVSIERAEFGWCSGIKIEKLQISKEASPIVCFDQVLVQKPTFRHPIVLDFTKDESDPYLSLLTIDHPVDIWMRSIRDVEIQLGKFQVQKGTLFNFLANILQLPCADGAKDQVWPTNVHLQIRHKIIHIQRVDVLLEGCAHVALWGDIDIIQDLFDITVAVPQKTLLKYVKIPLLDSLIDPQFMLFLPFKGKLSANTFDTAEAMKQVASLTSKVAGQMFSQLLPAPLTCQEGEPNIPPPLETPFPWEDAEKIAENQAPSV